MNSEKETYNYKGWLISDSFHKRVFAILGYSIVGQLYILLGIVAFLIILTFIGGFL